MTEPTRQLDCVARCKPLPAQHATNAPTRATLPATRAQRTSLKALALVALSRNNVCNDRATGPENPRNKQPLQDGDLLRDLRARLLTLAEREAIDAGIVHALPKSELAATVEQLAAFHAAERDNILRGYLRTLADDAERRAGRVPRGDTAAVLCRRCGPVYLHPSIAQAAPVVHGWPVVLGCPWCFVPKDGALAIPRPPVTCGTCQQFTRDTINPEGGAGTCAAGLNPSRPWPNAQQYCAGFAAGHRLNTPHAEQQ